MSEQAKLSTEIASASRIVGREKAIELVAKAGFTAFDLSMFDLIRYDWQGGVASAGNTPLNGSDYVAYARSLKKIGLDNGIVCNQSHAPFPTFAKGIKDWVLRAIECTAIVGGKICVVHPDNNKCAEENAEFFFDILPFARSCGVKIATENMWNWNDETNRATRAACSFHDDFLNHVLAVNDEYFGACLDIGHAEMFGEETSAVKMIETLGEHLIALHIHDNNKLNDSHAIPYSMDIDFAPIASALKRRGYKGDFTLEADTFLSDHDETNVSIGLKKLYDACKRFYDEFLNA